MNYFEVVHETTSASRAYFTNFARKFVQHKKATMTNIFNACQLYLRSLKYYLKCLN